jgi:hypothetical protein
MRAHRVEVRAAALHRAMLLSTLFSEVFYRARPVPCRSPVQGVGAYNAGDIQRAIQQFKSAAPSKGVLFNLGA